MKIFAFAIILFISVPLYSYEPNAADKKIINFTFNEDYNNARKMIDELIKSNSTSPKYYYYMVNLKVLEYYHKLAEMNSERREEGRKALNKELIDYCENVLTKFNLSKLDTENKFYYGSIYGYLARVQGLDKSWWGAFRSGQKTEDIMEQVLKEDPNFFDAYLLLGMLNYYADRLSGITSFIAGVLGYSGDRDKGLQQLKLAYDKGKLTFGQSALTLIEVYTSLEDNDEAAKNYYEKFLQVFPNNKRVLNSYFQRLLNIGDYKKAESIVNNDSNKMLDDYSMAVYFHVKGNFKQALDFAEKAIADKNKLWRGRLEYVYYIAAVNSRMIGDYNISSKYEKELNDDLKTMLNIAKNKPNEFKWLLDLSYKITNGIAVNDFENHIKSKPNFSNTRELEEEFNIIAGRYYYFNNMFGKAEYYFVKCFKRDDNGIKYTALKYTTDIYNRQNTDKKKVEKLLDEIDDFDNDRLSFRAKDLEKKYNL